MAGAAFLAAAFFFGFSSSDSSSESAFFAFLAGAFFGVAFLAAAFLGFSSSDPASSSSSSFFALSGTSAGSTTCQLWQAKGNVPLPTAHALRTRAWSSAPRSSKPSSSSASSNVSLKWEIILGVVPAVSYEAGRECGWMESCLPWTCDFDFPIVYNSLHLAFSHAVRRPPSQLLLTSPVAPLERSVAVDLDPGADAQLALEDGRARARFRAITLGAARGRVLEACCFVSIQSGSVLLVARCRLTVCGHYGCC